MNCSDQSSQVAVSSRLRILGFKILRDPLDGTSLRHQLVFCVQPQIRPLLFYRLQSALRSSWRSLFYPEACDYRLV